MSFSLKSLKGGYIGHYMGDYPTAFEPVLATLLPMLWLSEPLSIDYLPGGMRFLAITNRMKAQESPSKDNSGEPYRSCTRKADTI